MGASTSIAQEYYKVQDYWRKADAEKKWRLALWVVNFHDVDIIDKFMGIEASPLGRFDDIFFHFESEYKGDDNDFEKSLYNEYLSWFDEPHKDDIDILRALKNDNFFVSDYQPDREQKPVVENLWKEMLLLKSCIKGLEDCNFCIYIKVNSTDSKEMTGWYKDILDRGIPAGIRLVAIDYAEKRKIKLRASSKVNIIQPELNMQEAINNEISKGAYQSNTVGPEGRYRKQITIVLNCSQSSGKLQLEKEINKLLTISKEMDDISAITGTYMIVSLAYFYNRNNEKCEEYADKAIREAEEQEKVSGLDLYPTWKGAIMLKAAILMLKNERREAITTYQKLADKATQKGDAFFIMESYRLIGHLYYELAELTNAFEHTLLAIAGGSYLEKEVRRQSTFLQAANLALYLGESTRGLGDVKIIEEQLEDLLGKDWESLVRNENMDKSKIRRKASIFS